MKYLFHLQECNTIIYSSSDNSFLYSFPIYKFLPYLRMRHCICFQILQHSYPISKNVTLFPNPRFSISSSLPLCICSFCTALPTNYRCHSPEIPLHQKPDQSIFRPSRLQLYTQFKFCKNTNIIPAIVLFSVSTLISFQSVQI